MSRDEYFCEGIKAKTDLLNEHWGVSFRLRISPRIRSQNPQGFNSFVRDLCLTDCITVSGSNFHQLLAAWEKRRKSPNLLKGLEPPAYQVSNKVAPPLKVARPPSNGRALIQRGAPHSNQHLPTISTLQLDFPFPPHMAWDLLFLPAPLADPFSLLTPRPWGDHIPLHPLWHGIYQVAAKWFGNYSLWNNIV